MSDLPKNETAKETATVERSAESLATSLTKFLKNWWGSPKLDVESHLKDTLKQYGRQERDKAIEAAAALVEGLEWEEYYEQKASVVEKIRALKESYEYSENNAPRSGAW